MKTITRTLISGTCFFMYLTFPGLLNAQKVGIGSVVFAPQNMLDVKGAMVVGNTYSGVNTAPANGLLVEGNTGIGITAPTEKLDVVGNVKFSGALMPNNLPGAVDQVLLSNGAGLAPKWGAYMTAINAVERWYYPPTTFNANTVYQVTATGVTGCTTNSSIFICLNGEWTIQPNITINHVEARNGVIRFRLTNNDLFTTYLGMDFNITVIR